ncbi:MAG TPA: nuclear transport factor 2 family protein [Sphingomicrobium sp.]|nr:nuclear transport factor 2 family protein [Sphingomicrobium sp.]
MTKPADGRTKTLAAGLEATIRQCSERWMQAWVAQDRTTLEDSLAADFALIVSADPDQRFERSRWLATCDTYRCSTFAYRGVQVRELAPGIAVMSAIAEQQARMGEVDRSGSFFVTDVWRLEPGGNWRICARYSAHPEPDGTSFQALGRLGQ